MTRTVCALALLLCIGAAFAQAGPQGSAQIEGPPRDAEFGVATRQAALQRHVEMYQWQKVGDRYLAAWSEQLIDSQGFDQAHRNPEEFPLWAEQWRAARVSLDGKPLSQGIIDALGVWRDLRPNFSRLPANLAATFQPEGDGLGSAENPLDPQIGDLRVTWRELHLPPLADRLVLRDGVWHAAVQSTPAPMPSRLATSESHDWSLMTWLSIAGAAGLLLWLLLSRRSKRRD